MDALSQLLSLGRSHVELDVRCLLDGSFAMPHDPLPPGEAAFHLLLAGTCLMRTANGRALQLADGDFVLRAEASNAQPGARAIVNALGQALLAYALRAYGRDASVPAGWLALAADARLGPSVQAVLQAPAQP